MNPADAPVLFLTLSSPTLPLSEVNRYADNLLAQRLSMVSGVAQVTSSGRRSTRCASISIRPSSRHGRLASTRWRRRLLANSNRPTGILYGPDRNFVVDVSGQLMEARPTAMWW